MELTDDQVRTLWIALLLGKTLGDRLIIAHKVLGPWPDDIMEDKCALCGAEQKEEE